MGIEATPKMQDCASTTDNCMANKCCKTSSMKCWRISDSVGRCSKTCPGGNCWVENPCKACKAGPHVQGHFPFLLHGLRREQGQGYPKRQGSRDPPDAAQKWCGSFRLQRLGSLQR